MNPKRPIDALRDSGGSMDIGTKAEGAITDLISTAEALYIVKERSVYAVQTADQIDPGRTNPVIPNTQQRVLAIGSESPIVVRTLLTGQTLFKKTMLGKEFDEQSAIGLALGLLKDLAAMDDVRSSLEEAERLARASYEKESNRNRSALPSLGDCKARLDAYAQKAGHVVNCLEEISKLFYGKSISVKWIDSLSRLVEA